MRRILYIAVVLVTMALGASSAQAAPPVVTGTWATDVGTTSANLRAEIDPAGTADHLPLRIHRPRPTYRAKGFAGAARIPATGVGDRRTGTVLQHTAGLEPDTGYRFRAVATNNDGVNAGPIRRFATREAEPVFTLPDERGWEMVSPVDKNGGSIQGFGAQLRRRRDPGRRAGGHGHLHLGLLLPEPSTARRAPASTSPGRGDSAWSTENVTPAGALRQLSRRSGQRGPLPALLLRPELRTGLSNGRRCRTSVTKQCPVENPPLAGSGAPAGYRNYYLRDNSSGSFKALLTERRPRRTQRSAPRTSKLAFAGATPDLAHVVLSSCAALTATATEVAGTEGECDPDQTEPLSEVRLLTPGADQSAPGRRHRHPRRDPRRPEPGDLHRRLPRLLDRRHQASTCAKAPRPNRSTRRRGEAAHSRPPAPTARSPSSPMASTSTATPPPTDTATDLTTRRDRRRAGGPRHLR